MAKSLKRRKTGSSISISNECEVDETKRTVPLAPVRQGKRARQPIAAVAVDRRKQIVDARPRR